MIYYLKIVRVLLVLLIVQSFSNEMQAHSQSLTTLNNMSHELLTTHHANDDTLDLQDTMKDLNVRWKKVMER